LACTIDFAGNMIVTADTTFRVSTCDRMIAKYIIRSTIADFTPFYWIAQSRNFAAVMKISGDSKDRVEPCTSIVASTDSEPRGTH
jgi:hypothetical protein